MCPVCRIRPIGLQPTRVWTSPAPTTSARLMKMESCEPPRMFCLLRFRHCRSFSKTPTQQLIAADTVPVCARTDSSQNECVRARSLVMNSEFCVQTDVSGIFKKTGIAQQRKKKYFGEVLGFQDEIIFRVNMCDNIFWSIPRPFTGGGLTCYPR